MTRGTAPNRRTFLAALAGGGALGTGMVLPALATGPDTELIQLCNRLVAIGKAEQVLHDTVGNERERDAALEPLNAEWWAIEDRLRELDDPVTRAGAVAMARAAMAHCDRDPAGLPVSRDLGHSLLIGAALWLEGAGA